MPDAAQDAELLTAAAVALNRHAPMLAELGSAFEAAATSSTSSAVRCGMPCWAG